MAPITVGILHEPPGLSEESDAKKVQALNSCFSRETLSIVQNFGLSDEERTNVATIIGAIKKKYIYISMAT